MGPGGGEGGFGGSPPDEALGRRRQLDVVGEVQALPPVDDLAVRVVAVLGTEGRPAHEALVHDGAQRPPVDVIRVALASEYLRRDVVGRSSARGSQFRPTTERLGEGKRHDSGA